MEAGVVYLMPVITARCTPEVEKLVPERVNSLRLVDSSLGAVINLGFGNT